MAAPNIEGTYQLVRREFPDGTVQVPPAMKGMLTFTGTYRNFSVVWSDHEGRYYSECYVARYSLTDSEYTEVSEYLIVDDQIGGKGISYDLSNVSASAPVSVENGQITFALPQEFERALSITVSFDGDGMKATIEGQFIDHWEKVA